MVLPGHLAGGYLAAKAALFLAGSTLSSGQAFILLSIGALAGEVPDVDLIFFYFDQRQGGSHRKECHREYFTHAPFFWLALCLVLTSVGWMSGDAFISLIGLTALAGTLSHFILDSIDSEIRWLWPFSNKGYRILKPKKPEVSGAKGTFAFYWNLVASKEYLTSVSFYLEIALAAAALWVAFH